jgi:hypothetical protein
MDNRLYIKSKKIKTFLSFIDDKSGECFLEILNPNETMIPKINENMTFNFETKNGDNPFEGDGYEYYVKEIYRKYNFQHDIKVKTIGISVIVEQRD